MVTDPAPESPVEVRAEAAGPPPPAAAPSATPANDPQTMPDGELRPAELLFRLGVLGCAGAFLIEGMGAPWNQSPVFLAAALLVSALVVTTMALQWRVLGDWRRWTQQVTMVAMVLVVAVPLAAALNPRLGNSLLPEGLETGLTNFLAAVEKIPGLGTALAILQNLIVFALYALVLVVLLATTGATQRGGLALVGAIMAGVGLFFHPTAETIVGFALLVFFLRLQWERPLLVPAKLRPHLSASQLAYLRELVSRGSLSTGETKLYLDNDAPAFGQLLEFGLVEYDKIVREVVPGARLIHDPAAETLEKALGFFRRILWILAGCVYLLMPDLIPGPIDDFLVMAVCSGAGLGWLEFLLPGRGKKP